MGSAVGQEPEVLNERSPAGRGVRDTLPVLVKLTPNIGDILDPALAGDRGRRARRLAHQHHQEHRSASTSTGSSRCRGSASRSTNGGYCGPAVKPIALHMVAALARDPRVTAPDLAASAASPTWRDAAEFIALGATSVQVCTAVMHYGFRIVEDMIEGLVELPRRAGHEDGERAARPGGPGRSPSGATST